MSRPDPFEDRLRAVLRGDSPGSAEAPSDTETILANVHSGAASRRRRRAAGIAAAAALVVGGGAAVGGVGLLDRDNAAQIADSTITSASTDGGTTGSTGTTPSTQPTTSAAPLPAVLSITSTGNDHQWALARVDRKSCPDGACAVVYGRTADGLAWTPLGKPLAYSGADTGDPAAVSQLRFVGAESTGYDGWAFGPGLLSTHGDAAGTSWSVVRSGQLGSIGGNAIFNVDDVEARGTTVYALMRTGEASAALISSPTDHDDFAAVDVGITLQAASDLNVSAGVVAFLSDDGGVASVVSSTADAETGAATGPWQNTQPCSARSGVQHLSSSADLLWALCTDGSVALAKVSGPTAPVWTTVQADVAQPARCLLAARGSDSAVVACPDGLSAVTADGAAPTSLTPRDFHSADLFGFTNDSLGFAVVDGRIYRTMDGGLSWPEEPIAP